MAATRLRFVNIASGFPLPGAVISGHSVGKTESVVCVSEM